MCVALCACGNKDNLKVRQRFYVDCSDYWGVATQNGYICTEYNIIQNEDGSYTVTFKIDKPFKGQTNEA